MILLNTVKANAVHRLHQWANELRDHWGEWPSINILHLKHGKCGQSFVSEKAMEIDEIVREIRKESTILANCLIVRYFFHRQTTEWQRRQLGLTRYQFLDCVDEAEKAVQEFLLFIAEPIAFFARNGACAISIGMVNSRHSGNLSAA